MKLKIVLAGLSAVVLSGCMNGPDSQGWRSSQKDAFLKILETDKYMSLCNQKPLYAEVKSSQNSVLMTQLLVKYANNLANGCIDIASFKASQKAKKSKEIETHYGMVIQKVNRANIEAKLKAGVTIEEILKPYVPQVSEFDALIEHYHALAQDQNVSQRVLRKVRLNIERVKLLPQNLGTNYLLVNIPEMKVRLFEHGEKKIEFRTVVGKPNLQTPVFSARLQYVMVNPQWNVPDSIARKSIIPRYLRGGEGYLAAKGMEIHRSYDLSSPKVNGANVDWSKYPKDKKGYVPYKFIQKPSLKNGLGRVKFMFPNHFAVYMHDTQAKSLFKRQSRCYSHGCIRLEKPVTLLHYVTKHYSNETIESITKRYNSRKSYMLRIRKPLLVHVVYLTAYVDTDGKLRLFNDVYGFDKSQKLTF
jgi:hypothetical protein